jgi:cell surface protein SprA
VWIIKFERKRNCNIDSGFNASVSEGRDYSNKTQENPNQTNTPIIHNLDLSLQQRLANDEVLAVAYQYTIGDQVLSGREFAMMALMQLRNVVTTRQTMLLFRKVWI